jgi:hypothetical protein
MRYVWTMPPATVDMGSHKSRLYSVLSTVEAESAPAGISLVWSHVLGRGSLPLHPELPPVVHSMHERLTRRIDLLLYSTALLYLLCIRKKKKKKQLHST